MSRASTRFVDQQGTRAFGRRRPAPRLRWWRWLLACLLLTFVAPAPALARFDDEVVLVAGAAEAEPTPACADVAPKSALAAASPSDTATCVASASRKPARLYLVNCALLR